MRYLLPDDVAFEARLLAAEGLAEVTPIGEGELREWMWVLRVGDGPLQVAVCGNAHADEPAGTVTCFRLARWLAETAPGRALARGVTFHLLPTANPKGLRRNRGWLGSEAPDRVTWYRYIRRDAPPDDREFGYGATPDEAAHPECAAWHRYLESLPDLQGYVSLHSMAYSGGAWFLTMLDDLNASRPLLDDLAGVAATAGLPLHDEDRGGRKGFHRLEPGFCTAPTRDEMVAFFELAGTVGAASWLRLNSMQVARQLHDPSVALVTELPQWWDPELADPTPVTETRQAVDRRCGDELEKSVKELNDLMASAGRTGEEGAEGEAVAAHRITVARALIASAERWGDRSAARRDIASSELRVLHAKATNAALALRLWRAVGREPGMWVPALLRRVRAIEDRFHFRPFPLSRQVETQQAVIVSLAKHILRKALP